MRDERLTELFVRFRDRHDGKALAQLFDATARELLSVAAHLVDDASQAEDLVQTTFQVAIERAGSFDPAHGVKGWLYGILWREAAKLRRQRARTVDQRRLSPTLSADPLSEAIAGELPRTVTEALSGLPARYREVLVPLLCEDRSAGDIARELGRAPGTVRVQIQRGLERLRKSLPKSLSLSAVAVLPGRGLESVRRAALQHAGFDPILHPTAGGVGWSLLVPAAAGVVVVGTLGIWARSALRAQEPRADTALALSTAPLRSRGSESNPRRLDDLPVPDRARTPAAQPHALPTEGPPVEVVFRTEPVSVIGRITASEAPCAGAFVRLYGAGGVGLLTARADLDGRYRIDEVVPGPYAAFVSTSVLESHSIDFGDVLVGDTDRIADFELPAGSIEGTIRDIELPPRKAGSPGRIQVFPRNGRVETGNVGQFVEPDDQGRFLARNLRPGEYTVWFLDAEERTHRKAVVLDAHRSRETVLFEPSDSNGALVGRVIGLAQAQGTTVDAYPIDAGGADLAAWCGGDFDPESGRFEITGLEPGHYGLLVCRWGGGGAFILLEEFLWLSPFEVIAGGATDLGDVPMQSGRMVELRLDPKRPRATWQLRMPSGDWLPYVVFCGGRASGHRAPEKAFFLPYGQYPLRVDFGSGTIVEELLRVEPGTGAVELTLSAPPR